MPFPIKFSIPCNLSSVNIQNGFVTYLIKRYFNPFFEYEIQRDQLKLELFNGKATVEDITLNVQTINQNAEDLNWPFELVDGYIETIELVVPWMRLLKEHTTLCITGLKATIQPKQRNEAGESMFESMWNSMTTSSMQLAEEYANEEPPDDGGTENYEGIAAAAQAIETILGKLQATLVKTELQIEHVPKGSIKGVGLLIKIELIKYCKEDDETEEEEKTAEKRHNKCGTSDEEASDDEVQESEEDKRKAYLLRSFSSRKIWIEGVTISTIEFDSCDRTMSRSLIESKANHGYTDKDGDVYYDSHEHLPQDEEVDQSEGCDNTFFDSEDRIVILCGEIMGTQEVKIRIKKSEEFEGPKVILDVDLGLLNLFCSPRQFHIVRELCAGFLTPSTEDSSNVAPVQTCKSKQMSQEDYDMIQQQLEQLLTTRYHNANLSAGQGWSSAMDDGSSNDYTSAQGYNYEAFSLSGVSSLESSMMSGASTFANTEYTYQSRRKGSAMAETDSTAEISLFHIRISSFSMVLLHEDLFAGPTCNKQVIAKQMHNTAKDFFSSFNNYNPEVLEFSDFDSFTSKISGACRSNHLRLSTAPISIEVDEKTTSSIFSITSNVTATFLQLIECLQKDTKVEQIPLIYFHRPEKKRDDRTNTHSMRMRLRHIERLRKSRSARKNIPKTDVSLLLEKCSAEVDISLMDRISGLVYHPEICQKERRTNDNVWQKAQDETAQMTDEESHLDIKLSSPEIVLKLRFPVPDFRPAHDINKVPWWERNVRQDYLKLTFSDVTGSIPIRTYQQWQELVIESKLMDVFYYESENSVPLHVASATLDEKPFVSNNYGDVCVSLKFYPKKSDEECEELPDPMAHSCYGVLENQGRPNPGPFSVKRVYVTRTDTAHSKLRKDNSISHECDEEQVIPGNNAEIEDFIKTTIGSVEILIDIKLPALSLHLKSKHIYELLYNRITNDLLMWQPSAPKVNVPPTSLYEPSSSFVGTSHYLSCKGGAHYASDSDSEEESDPMDYAFHSTYDKSHYTTNQTESTDPLTTRNSQSYCAVNLHIGRGIATLLTPFRDGVTNSAVPGRDGELSLQILNGDIFVVGGYRGDDDLGYVCVQTEEASLYHCDMLPCPSSDIQHKLPDLNAELPKHLLDTVYRSENGTLADCKNRGDQRKMITVAVKIESNYDSQYAKNIQVSVGLNKATLRHRMCHEPNTWISHILDFFNVQNYPLEGYVPKDVLTELHLHLWDCAIDYRPLSLPCRSLLSIGNFSLTSNLATEPNTSALRFIFEECGLYLSDRGRPRNGVASNSPAVLKRDYVNVIDVGLFEISLKTADKKLGAAPFLDFRAFNNMVTVRTCSDSAKTLMQLITYFANDGDLNVDESNVPEQILLSDTVSECSSAQLISLEPIEEQLVTESQQKHVSKMLEDAINDDHKGEEDPSLRGPELFFFPNDESSLDDDDEPVLYNPSRQTREDLGDINMYRCRNCNDEDGFHILSSKGIFPKGGVPEVTWAHRAYDDEDDSNENDHTLREDEDYVFVVHNHIKAPEGKKDILQPPENFPTPTTRYTLCEMTLVWQIFAGKDFATATSRPSSASDKHVKFSDILKPGSPSTSVHFSTHDNEVRLDTSITTTEKKWEDMDWKVRGGSCRNHSILMELELTKVRFQHEVYPETDEKASRQTLAIVDVEIRDKLDINISQIHKFLYQFESEMRPRRSDANMVVVKALHIRPDLRLKAQECSVKISLLPIRLNIDQDALLFMINFFKELSGDAATPELSKQNTPTHSSKEHQPPIMTVNENPNGDDDEQEQMRREAQKAVNANLILLMSNIEQSKMFDMKELKDMEESIAASSTVPDDSPTFFRKLVFSPDVFIRVDYNGKRIDMSQGPIAGLLMGLGQLHCSELKLKRIVYKHGLLGVAKLINYLLEVWLDDIKRNQLATILGGLGPMHSLLQLFQGIRDLFWLPIEQYQKDGRIMRGIVRGANSFTTLTAMAALELTSRLLYLIQLTAETAFDMLSPGPSISSKRLAKTRGRKKRYHQPQDIRDGLNNACMVLREGIGETADNLVNVAVIENEHKGISGAVGGIIRQIPPTILKPVILGVEATNNVLEGIQCQLIPDAKKEANQKWK